MHCCWSTFVSFITEPLRYLSNLSLGESFFPTELKLTHVIPLYKSDDAFVLNNYRLVSLLYVISEILKRLCITDLCNLLKTLLFWIISYLGLENAFNIHGFNDSYEYINHFIWERRIYLNFPKAFDTVDYLQSWHSMISEALLWNGLRMTSTIYNSMRHTMDYLRQNKG